MKKYIIITYNVCNMGGGQLYVLRRCKYLEKLGFEVKILVTFDNGIFPLKKDFSDTPVKVVPELGRAFLKTGYHQRNQILSEIISFIGPATDIFIESHTLPTIEWGEIIANILEAKHLAYPLAEPSVKNYKFLPGKRIFKDKLKRREFYGCTSASLEKIFGYEIYENNYINVGFYENELVSYCIPSIDYKKIEGDYVITTVSRLDKTYIEKLIYASIELANKYKKQKFVLIIAGGSNTGTREHDLKTEFSKSFLPNLKIIFTGYINKLGKDIFKISDVFVGMGTASINAISQNCITINIDPSMNDLASGFFARDTNNFAYSENGCLYSILEKLEESYLMSDEDKKLLKKEGRELFDQEYEAEACFKKLDASFNIIPIVNNRKSCKFSPLYGLLLCSLYYLKNLLIKLLPIFK